MLIEDDTDDQEFFREALSRIGHATLYGIAQNGKEALGILRDSHILPDLIFSDINMPVMNGIECLAELKTDPRFRRIPVIILSSAEEESIIASTLGARAFINKQNSFNELCGQIGKCISEDVVVAAGFPVVSHYALSSAA